MEELGSVKFNFLSLLLIGPVTCYLFCNWAKYLHVMTREYVQGNFGVQAVKHQFKTRSKIDFYPSVQPRCEPLLDSMMADRYYEPCTHHHKHKPTEESL